MNWKCPGCDKTAVVAGGIKVQCSVCGTISQAPPRPPLKRRLTNYAKARMAWEAAGRPVRTDEQVDTLRAICAACEDWFDGEVCTHSKCGCKVTRPGFFGDKLRWETEHCPVEKW